MVLPRKRKTVFFFGTFCFSLWQFVNCHADLPLSYWCSIYQAGGCHVCVLTLIQIYTAFADNTALEIIPYIHVYDKKKKKREVDRCSAAAY